MTELFYNDNVIVSFAGVFLGYHATLPPKGSVAGHPKKRLRSRLVSLLLLFFSYYYNNILTFIVVPYCFLHVLFRSSPDEELLSNSRRTSGTDCDSPRHQMEMLSFSIARTNFNKQTGTMTVYRGINF